MMDHLRERWEYIRDFVIFDGIIRCGEQGFQDAIDSEHVLFPTCDEYLATVGQDIVEKQGDGVISDNFEQRAIRG